MADSMDWNNLASQPLPSLFQPTGTNWAGSAAELGTVPAAPPPSTTTPVGGAVGPGTPAAGWPSLATARSPGPLMVTRAAGGPSLQEPRKLPVDDWDARVAQQEQEMIERILQRAADKTRQRLDEKMEQLLQAAWKRERDKWIKDVLGATAPTDASPLRVYQIQDGPAAPGDGQLIPLASRAAPTSPSFQLRSALAFSSGHLDPTLVRDHLDIITFSAMERPITVVRKLSSLNLPSGDLSSGYRLMWRYIEELLKMNTDSPNPVDQATAYLIFLCQQTQSYIINRVRSASLAGQNIGAAGSQYENNMASTCASFVQLVLGESAAAQPWPTAYFCLRCGDAVAATEVLMAAGFHRNDQSSDASLLRLVKAMAAVQGNKACLWEGSVLRIDATDREAVAALLGSAKNQEEEDLYQIGFYTLCCTTDVLPTSDTLFGFSSVEDYLCGALWKALVAARPLDELLSFGETITEYGPFYFGENFLPFFVSQQYETVLTHLATDFGRLGYLYAVHLGLILWNANVPCRNLNRGEANSASVDLVVSLIVTYSEFLLTDDSFEMPAALEYLVRIPNKARARHEVASLIAKTGQTDKLAGSLNIEGIRVGPSLLDKHFSSDEISGILSDAASLLLRDGSDQDRLSMAVLCLSLAGKFFDALGLMNSLLSPPDQPDAYREHWMFQVDTFCKNFLSKPSYVVDRLGKENKASIIATTRTMLDLNRFFQLLRNGKHEQAWTVLENQNFLPKTSRDLSSMANEFPRLDQPLKQALPAVLVAAIEILHTEYTQTQRRALHLSPSMSVSQERLRELKDRIQTFATYASLTGLSLTHEQLSTINRVASVVS